MSDNITEQGSQISPEPMSASKIVEAGEKIDRENANNPSFLEFKSQAQAKAQLLIEALKARSLTEEQLVNIISITQAIEQEKRKTAEALSEIDTLTETYNRRGLERHLEKALAHADRSNEDLSIAIIDIDHFKGINDKLGHPIGDIVLKEAVKFFQLKSRDADIVARWGGEEFVILMPSTDENGAVTHLENLRSNFSEYIAQKLKENENPDAAPVTLSAGIASRTKREPDDLLKEKPNLIATSGQMTKAADLQLYKAKESGRNKVEPSPKTKENIPQETSTDIQP